MARPESPRRAVAAGTPSARSPLCPRLRPVVAAAQGPPVEQGEGALGIGRGPAEAASPRPAPSPAPRLPPPGPLYSDCDRQEQRVKGAEATERQRGRAGEAEGLGKASRGAECGRREWGRRG